MTHSAGPTGSRLPALLAALLPALSGCDFLASEVGIFVVRVDRIEAPATAGPTDTVTVRFIGTVGPNGCYSLDGVFAARAPGLLRLKFQGSHSVGACAQAVVPLDHTERLVPPLADPFTVSVIQPSGPDLEAVIRIVSP